jgi:ABC-type uncharacterized transport system substrate-binding protein
MGAFAHELVGLQPDVILSNRTPNTIAVQRETRTIPVVFASVDDRGSDVARIGPSQSPGNRLPRCT